MKEELRNPGKQHRPIPFWSWNETIQPDEVKRQIRTMSEQGLGGYFMHARSGLTLDYLKDEWFSCIQAGIEEAKETGLDAWIYDEEGWPSGFAGGIVTGLSSDYHARFITFEKFNGDLKELEEYAELRSRKDLEDVEADKVYSVKTIRRGDADGKEDHRNENGILAVYQMIEDDYQRLRPKSVRETYKKTPEKIWVIRRHVQRFYIDVMNKEAVKAFLTVTHEEYYKRFSESFGKEMKGFFTDEPRIACNRFGELAWSEQLDLVIKERYGYELLDVLPCLFREFSGHEKVRYDFWSTVNDLFVTNYMKQIYDWCESHNCMLTGHIMLEESIFGQMTSSAGVMPFYEYEHIPGIDWLRRRIESPVIAKQVGSVAAQLGKRKVLTESFALTGWNVSFEELKWIMEWQYVNGVNMLCQHLQAYSLKGSRKRDYPPSLYEQQSWWEEYRQFTDYTGRLGLLLSEGNERAKVLVLHPMRSGYLVFNGSRTEQMRSLDDHFTKLSCALSGEHISYHYGDETILKKHACVTKEGFHVGEVTYKAVILPQMYAIDHATILLLLAFAEQGGKLYYTGEFPSFSNDGGQERIQQLQEASEFLPMEDIRKTLAGKGLSSVSIAEQGQEVKDIACQLRDTEEGLLILMVNLSTDTRHSAVIDVQGYNAAELIHAEDGSSEDIVPDEKGLILTFEPRQSHIVLYKKTTGNAQEKLRLDEFITIIEPKKEWKIEQMGRNSLTLDMCRYSIDGQEIAGPIATIKLMKKLLDLQRDCAVTLYYDFMVSTEPEQLKELFLAMEDLEKYSVFINETKVDTKPFGTWKDRSFSCLDILPLVKKGSNQLMLTGVFHQSKKVYDTLYGDGVYETELNKLTYDMEMEAVYLVGDFGVISKDAFRAAGREAVFTAGPFEIVPSPKQFTGHNFTEQGLLFFAEDLTVSQTFERIEQHKSDHQRKSIDQRKDNERIQETQDRVILRYGKQNAPMIDLWINDIKVKTSMWAPYEADITDAVKNGTNTLTMRFYASNRNLFGPHHHINGECYNVGPSSFTGEWSWVERESEADATDIADRTKNYWTDAYSFVAFGLQRQE